MPKKLKPFIAFTVSDFRNFLLGAFASEIGNQMQIVAVSWQIYELTHSPASLGFIGLATLIPILLFSLLGGLVADKMDRKRLLLLSQAGLGVLALILFILTITQTINQWYIYLVLILVSTANSFSMPARQAVLPSLVPQKFLMNAVSLNTLQYQISIMVGPAIAGILIASFGVSTVYLVNGLSFLVFIFTVMAITIPQIKIAKEIEFNLSAIWEGIRFVASSQILYATMILDFLATFFGTATILMPVFAKDILHVGPQGLGLLYSAPAIGGVIAGLILASFHRLENQGKIIIGSVIVYGLATIGFGLSKYLPLSLAFLILVGFGDMISTVIRNTLRQMATPEHLRGRMISIMRIFFQGGPQLGEIEAGLLAAAVGGPISVVVGGAGTILITTLIAYLSPKLRNYKGTEATL